MKSREVNMLLEKASELIRLARLDADLSETELAAQSGVTTAQLLAFESGSVRPDEVQTRRLLSAARARPSLPLMLYRSSIRAAATDHHLADVRVFGSAARGEDSESSDIDLLVRADEGTSLFDLAAFTDAVTRMTGFPST
jgi:predicted nucleotidyltransferase